MTSYRTTVATMALAAASLATRALLAPVAHAAAPHGEDTPLRLAPVARESATTTTGGGGLVRTFVGLAVVIAVIYGLYWVMRQVKASREERSVGHGLESVATIPLGPGRSLHMIRAGRELVLVGVGEHGVTPIRTYGEEEARAAGLLDEPQHDGPGLGAGAGPLRRRWVDALLAELRRWTVRR